ncbi:MAG: peptidoglycan DD-metalloendopeptidase family protein [Pseudomonadota bacterium]
MDQYGYTPQSGLAPIALLSSLLGGIALLAIVTSFLFADPSYRAQLFAPSVAQAVPATLTPSVAAPQQTSNVPPLIEAATSAARPERRTIVIPASRPERLQRQGRSLSPLAPTGAPEEPVKVYPAPKQNKLPVHRTLVELQEYERTWPRLRPGRLKPGVELAKAIDPGAVYLASEQVDAFASADDFTGGRQALFADYAQAQQQRRADQAYSTLVLNRGESVADTLTALGAQVSEVSDLLAAAGQKSPISKLKPGMAFDYAFETIFVDGVEGQEKKSVLARIRFYPDSRHVVTAWRSADGNTNSRIEELEVQHRYAAVGGVIRHSLFAAAQRSEVPPEIMVQFANLFLYDVDYARDIQSGDRYEAVYDVYFDENGAFVSSGDIHFAAMSWRGNRYSRGYYRFEGAEGMDIPYFDENGGSANRLLMKTPIEGARVTSSFGLRRHPVLGYTKAHKGVDFGAPSGTPIMAAGDGVVMRAGPAGTFGNYVRIKHAKGYETAYAHLKGFARGIAKGKKVRQGDVIGYVGSTGRSTGPHLHYEVHQDGEVLNPMTLKVAGGRVLDDKVMDAFGDHRAFVDNVRVRPLTVASATKQ